MFALLLKMLTALENHNSPTVMTYTCVPNVKLKSPHAMANDYLICLQQCYMCDAGRAFMSNTMPVPPLWAEVTPNPPNLIIFILKVYHRFGVCGSVGQYTSVKSNNPIGLSQPPRKM